LALAYSAAAASNWFSSLCKKSFSPPKRERLFDFDLLK